MDLADNGVVAGIPQGIGEDLLERLLLGSKEMGDGAPRQASMNSVCSSSGFLEKYRRLWMSEERSLKAGNRKPVMGGCTHQSLGRSSMRLVASL